MTRRTGLTLVAPRGVRGRNTDSHIRASTRPIFATNHDPHTFWPPAYFSPIHQLALDRQVVWVEVLAPVVKEAGRCNTTGSLVSRTSKQSLAALQNKTLHMATQCNLSKQNVAYGHPKEERAVVSEEDARLPVPLAHPGPSGADHVEQ